MVAWVDSLTESQFVLLAIAVALFSFTLGVLLTLVVT